MVLTPCIKLWGVPELQETVVRVGFFVLIRLTVFYKKTGSSYHSNKLTGWLLICIDTLSAMCLGVWPGQSVSQSLPLLPTNERARFRHGPITALDYSEQSSIVVM